MKKILAVISLQLFYYLLWAFILWDFSYYGEMEGLRFIYALGALFILGFSIGYIVEINPEFLKTKTHEEKKKGIRKYIGELREELTLYSEANELLKKVKEYQQGKSN